MALTVHVVTPEREVDVCDDATLVIAKGVEGDFGVMPGRAPALIALGLGPLMIQRPERREQMLLDGGFMTVKNDTVIILAEYAVLPSELAATEVDEEIQRQRERLEQAKEDEDARKALARAQAARAMIRHG